MEAQLSAREMRATSRQLANLEPQALDAWAVLCESGPVLELGTILLTQDTWLLVPRNIAWLALDLHECGEFGAICEEMWERNERALSSRGSIVSFWEPSQAPEFWVVTDRCKSGITTTVSVMQHHES